MAPETVDSLSNTTSPAPPNAAADAGRGFDALSYSAKLRHVLSVEGAKTDETRRRRVAKAIDELRQAAR